MLSSVHPSVKVFREDFVSVELDNCHLVLFEHLDGLECLLVPLLEGDLHLVLTQPLDDLDELLEGAMALLIKSAVSEEFI